MKYSEERIKNLAFKIHDQLYMNEDVDYTDDEKALAFIKKIMIDFFSLEDKTDTIVTNKVLSLKKGIAQGSPEWYIMYQKYFEEEMAKHKW